MKEMDELKAARDRIRKLEKALADSRIEHLLEQSFLRVACERMGTTVEEFKKKHVLRPSETRRKEGEP